MDMWLHSSFVCGVLALAHCLVAKNAPCLCVAGDDLSYNFQGEVKFVGVGIVPADLDPTRALTGQFHSLPEPQ